MTSPPIYAFDSGPNLKVSVGFADIAKLIVQAASSITAGFSKSSNLSGEMLLHNILPGFTGRSFRHLLNNLSNFEDCVYLEVGSYCGSSLISSLYGNYNQIKHAYAIDNWSEFNEGDDPKGVFKKNLDTFIPGFKEDKLTVIEADCFSIDVSEEIKEKANVYFYDGHHSKESQKKAFTYFNDALCDTFITVIDDWEKGAVREGTFEAFSELGYKILAQWQIFPADREKRLEHPDINWWHGIALFVIKK